MRKSLTIYYYSGKHSNIQSMIADLAKTSGSKYQGRSNSEIARMVLLPALKKELLKVKVKKHQK